jgi:hypothetical protein
MHRIAIFLVLALAGFGVAAQDTTQAVQIPDIETFLDQQRDIREDMASKRKFKHVTDYDKRRLYAAQDQIFSLLDGRSSTDELNSDQLVAVYNAQEEVNAVLTDAELDRPICERETVVGSRMTKTVCLTVRERRDLQQAARQTMLKPRTCDPATGCGSN